MFIVARLIAQTGLVNLRGFIMISGVALSGSQCFRYK